MADARPLSAFLSRAKNMLLRPQGEWQVIKQEQTKRRQILAGYVSILAMIPPVAAVAKRLILDRGIAGSEVNSPISYVLTANVFWYVVIVVNVLIAAAVVTAFVDRNAGLISARGLKLAAYSFTPSFLVSFLLIIPRINWLIYVALLYSVYLLYLGIRALMELEKTKAAWFAAASVLATGLIVGILNMFEYVFESFLANRTFF